MKALVARGYGSPDRMEIVEMPTPEPGAGQILVRIAAASVNPTDTRVVSGGFKGLVDIDFPYVPGNDFAGMVVGVGPDVTRFQVDDELFGQALPRQLALAADPERPSLSTGAMAEYAVFEAATPLLVERPAAVSPEQAAALATGGWTAIGMMKLAAPHDGETALVIGGAGGVGTALIPMLVGAGARVIATARTDADVELLRGLGVAETIGYDPGEYPADVDIVFNMALFEDGLPAAGGTLRAGGRFVSIMFPPSTIEQLGRDDVELHVLADTGGRLVTMDEVAAAATAGTLVATIHGTYSLDRAVEALVAYDRREVRGNVVVTP